MRIKNASPRTDLPESFKGPRLTTASNPAATATAWKARARHSDKANDAAATTACTTQEVMHE
jgi:hypothetical protein